MGKRNSNNGRTNNNFKGNGRDINVSAKDTGFVNISDTSLVKDTANLNYSYLPGSPIMDALGASFNTVEDTNVSSIPGLVRLKTQPNIGVSQNMSDPINLASMQIYRKVRSVNSGAKNYDANNFMIYLMTMDSIYSFHAWMTRLYGVAGLYTKRNYYYPDMLVNAMGVDPKDLRANSLKLKTYMELYALRANTIAVPNVIPLIIEHANLYANIYSDANSILGQNYMFVPNKLYHYVENANAGDKFGTLQLTNAVGKNASDGTGDGEWTVQDIINFGDALLEDALSSEDLSVMSGDIQKAFPTDLLTIPTDVAADYTTEVVYDEDMLTAIHNADITPHFAPGPITADGTTDRIIQDLFVTLIGQYSWTDQVNTQQKRLYDMHKEDVSVRDNIIASRFRCVVDPTPITDVEPNHQYKVVVCGPDVIVEMGIYYMTNSTIKGSRVTQWTTIPQTYIASYKGDLNTGYNATHKISLLQYFDMAPFMYGMNSTQPKDSPEGSSPKYHEGFDIIGDVYNPTVVEVETIKSMMVAYFMQLFNI